MRIKDLTEVSVEDLNVCFTGSRAGITDKQYKILSMFLDTKPRLVRHGDCIGADTICHQLCLEKGYDESNLHLHPGFSERFRAFNEGGHIFPAKDNLARDRFMVMVSEVVIACPQTKRPYKGSGTWYTIRYAQSRAIPVYNIRPDGKVYNI